MRQRSRAGALGVVAAAAALAPGAAEAATVPQIVYQGQAPVGGVSGKWHIFTSNLDGAGRALTTGANNDVDPAVSPDGKKVAFAREDAANDYNIYVMNSDGTNAVRLTTDVRDDRYPTWSPDGSTIAYRGYNGPTGGSQIFTIAAGGGQRAAVPGTGGGDQPSWKPDGSMIAFMRTDVVSVDPVTQVETTDDDVFIIDRTGGVPTNLTNNDSTSDRYPAWSPTNANQILFRRKEVGGRELYSIDPTNPIAQNLSSGNLGVGRSAGWSPDGRSIAFISYRNGDGDGEIYLSSLTGTPAPLTNNDTAEDEPKWANVPQADSVVTPGTGNTGGGGGTGSGTGGGPGAVPSKPGGSTTVGGGTLGNGRQALSLTLSVPKKVKLGKGKTIKAFVNCNQACRITMSGSYKGKVGKKTKTFRTFKLRKSASSSRKTVKLKLPTKTLKAVRKALKGKKKVSFVINAVATNSAGEFTPTAARKVRVVR